MSLVRALRAVLLAALLALPAFPAAADPPIWRVHGRGGEIVLFGSVHLLSPGLAWTSPALLAVVWRPSPGPAVRAAVGHCGRAFAAGP